MMITSSSHIFEFDLARLVATSAFLTAPQPLQIPSSARKSNSNTYTDTKQIQTMNLKKREKSFGFHKNKQRATHPPRSGCPLAKSGAEPGRLTVLIQILHSSRICFLSMYFFWGSDKGLSCLIDLSVKVRSTLTVPFALQPPLDLLCPLFVCPSRAP